MWFEGGRLIVGDGSAIITDSAGGDCHVPALDVR